MGQEIGPLDPRRSAHNRLATRTRQLQITVGIVPFNSRRTVWTESVTLPATEEAGIERTSHYYFIREGQYAPDGRLYLSVS